MTVPQLRIGGASFREIRENGFYYVDKTAFLEEFLSLEPDAVSLITRPRRFGKSLAMSTLREFLDIRADSEKLFDGLAVSRNRDIRDRWMNKNPVLFLSLREAGGPTVRHALARAADVVREVCVEHSYLADSDKVKKMYRKDIAKLKSGKAGQAKLETSLFILCRALHEHWGRPAVVLIDEYDAPLELAEETGYRAEMAAFLRGFLGAVLKDNTSLKFGLLTGLMPVTDECILSGFNNCTEYGVADMDFCDKFGLTEEEVGKVLADAGILTKKAEIEKWYGGWRFGTGQKMYCPCDVLQYVKKQRKHPDLSPAACWSGGRGGKVVRALLDRTDLQAAAKLETLMRGGSIAVSLSQELICDNGRTSENSLWILLHLRGYLTRAVETQSGRRGSDQARISLVIPNMAVLHIFRAVVKFWLEERVRAMGQENVQKSFLDAFWSGDADEVGAMLTRALMQGANCFETREEYYGFVLTGLFRACGWYDMDAYGEDGRIRSDIVVRDFSRGRAAVIMVRSARYDAHLMVRAEAALTQLGKKMEALSATMQGCGRVLLWGVSVHGRKCLARTEERVLTRAKRKKP